jgi:hypothetical protein
MRNKVHRSALVTSLCMLSSACTHESATPFVDVPIAVVGLDQEVTVGAEVMVSGAKSYSPGGEPLTFAWTLRTRAPASAVALDDPTSPTVHFIADRAGTYVVELVVASSLGTSLPSTSVIVAHVDDTAPIAEAGSDLIVPPGETATFDGDGSSDPLGEPLLFAWTVVERPPLSIATLVSADSASPTFVPDVAGAYRLELVVQAGARQSAPDTVTLLADHPPVADAGPDLAVGLVHDVLLDASTSYDLDGDPLTYNWSMRSRPATSTASLWSTAWQATFTTDVEGLYEIDLEVGDWLTTDTHTISVVAGAAYGHAPVAVLDGDQTVDRGTKVSISAAASYDPDGDTVWFSWRMLSRPATSLADMWGSSPVGTFAPDLAGTYVVEVTATDPSMASSTASVTVQAIQQPLAPDVLDPTEVYLVGTLQPGSSGHDALTHWSTPHSYNAGFDDYFDGDHALIHPSSGRIWYTNTFEDRLREYYRDGGPDWLPGMPYPTNVLANDVITATPPCVVSGAWNAPVLSRFLIAPDGAVFHRCYGSTATWYDADGNAVFSGADLVYVGNGQVGMTVDSVVDLTTGIATPMIGLPVATVVSRRATTGGIWIVLAPAGTENELWLVDGTGSASQVGVYPALAPGVTLRTSPARLDGDGALFEIGYLADYVDVIVRRSVAGASEMVYTEADKPTVQIHISSLVTGP